MTSVVALGPAQLRSKFRGALIGAAVGDCFGAPYEGRPRVSPATFTTLLERGVTPLRHTDDTAMTAALAESLLEVGDLDQDHLARTFAERYTADPDRWPASSRRCSSTIASGRSGPSSSSLAASPRWSGAAEPASRRAPRRELHHRSSRRS